MNTKFLYVFLFFILNASLFSQEICNNAIDDDADGLIDLQDTADCKCHLFSSSATVTSLIPNPSFESHSNCCPSTYSELYCADNWIQASSATSDYFNTCDYTHLVGIANQPPGIPDGQGMVGFHDVNATIGIYKEYVGSCLLSPMLAGVSYTIQLYIFTADDVLRIPGGPSDPINLTIYGHPNCGNLPLGGQGCPLNIGSGWTELGSVFVNYSTNWQQVTITFTPTVNMAEIIIGPPCAPTTFDDNRYNYYYIDGLMLNTSSSFGGLSITSTGGYCTGDIQLTAERDTFGVGQYQWYKDSIAILGASGPIDSVYSVFPGVNGTGEYQVMVSYGTECALSAPFPILETSVGIKSSQEDLSCYQANDGQIFIENNGGTAPFQYFLNGTLANNDTIKNLAPGTYTVQIKDDNGCTHDTSLTIQEPAKVNIVIDPTQCLYRGLNTLSAQASGGTPNYTYHWNNSGFVGQNYTINLQNNTLTNVYALDANNCSTDTFPLDLKIVPNIDFFTDATAGCSPLPVNFTYFINNNVNNLTATSCLWDFGDGSTSTDCLLTFHEYEQSGLQTVGLAVQYSNGCVDSLTKNDLINVYSVPAPDFYAIPQPTTILNPKIHFVNQSSNAASYVWVLDTNNFFSTEVEPEYSFDSTKAGRYKICLISTSDEGCIDTICHITTIDDDLFLYIPNSFTPNGNKQNDVFKVYHDGAPFTEFELTVFNRWGQVVFETKEPLDAWDGTKSGLPCEQGVYSWRLDAKSKIDKKILRHGHVNLLR